MPGLYIAVDTQLLQDPQMCLLMGGLWLATAIPAQYIKNHRATSAYRM
jgi:hypothetical protein